MAKFFGKVGYADSQEEISPGVWKDVMVEFSYYGDIVRTPARKLEESPEKLNFDIQVENSISIVADAYANEHFFAIRYVEWAGTLWVVQKVEVQRPRLILRLGGVYNGPTAPAP